MFKYFLLLMVMAVFSCPYSLTPEHKPIVYEIIYQDDCYTPSGQEIKGLTQEQLFNATTRAEGLKR